MNSRVERTKSILVIDDEPMVLQLLKKILGSEGYDVNLAADGVYGMALYREKKPDLFLLDIMMPGPDGYQVIESIRQDGGVPVIMITGRRDRDSLQQALNSGADDYIRKPFRPLELMARVRSKLRRAEMRVS
ncbi:response regulator transcription factor [Chloroflexota bacterium]